MVKCDTELEFKSDLGMMVEYQIIYISFVFVYGLKMVSYIDVRII